MRRVMPSAAAAALAALGIGKDSANDVGVMGPHGGAANINNICFVGGRRAMAGGRT